MGNFHALRAELFSPGIRVMNECPDGYPQLGPWMEFGGE
jgi:hypothetical protein